MKTPEQIAREAVERLITVEKYEPEDGDYWVCIGRSPTQSGDAHLYHNKDDAEYDAAIYRINSVPIIIDAIEEALRQCPVPYPVSEEMYELGKLHGHMAGWREGAEAQQEMVRDSLRKAGYLTAEELVRLSGIALHAQEVTDE